MVVLSYIFAAEDVFIALFLGCAFIGDVSATEVQNIFESLLH